MMCAGGSERSAVGGCGETPKVHSPLQAPRTIGVSPGTRRRQIFPIHQHHINFRHIAEPWQPVPSTSSRSGSAVLNAIAQTAHHRPPSSSRPQSDSSADPDSQSPRIQTICTIRSIRTRYCDRNLHAADTYPALSKPAIIPLSRSPRAFALPQRNRSVGCFPHHRSQPRGRSRSSSGMPRSIPAACATHPCGTRARSDSTLAAARDRIPAASGGIRRMKLPTWFGRLYGLRSAAPPEL